MVQGSGTRGRRVESERSLPLRWTFALVSLAFVLLLPFVLRRFPGSTELLRTSSAFNDTILVEEDARGLRTLRFSPGGAIQSRVDPEHPWSLELPYAEAMALGWLAAPKLERTTMIGLGGGALAHFLHHHFPALEVHAVEIDPVVAQVAREWFALPEAVRVWVGDGRAFVEGADEATRDLRFDVVALDAYAPDFVPPHLATVEFLEAVRARLGDEGLVVANVWGPSANRLHDAMAASYLAVFPTVLVLDVPRRSNRVFLAFVAATTREAVGERVLAAGRALDPALGFPLEEAVARLARLEVPSGAAVLHDP